MNRRQVLRLGGLALTLSLAGCTLRNDQGTESAFTFTETGDMPATVRTRGFLRSYPGQAPFAEVVLGERPDSPDQVHGVEVYNDSERVVTISLTITRGVDEDTLVVDGEGTILAGEYMTIALSTPATYYNTLAVRGDGLDLQRTFEVSQRVWDAPPAEYSSIGPEHNIHIHDDEIAVRFVGTE